ncbi:two pore calcium channel protein 1-like, partial [Trifolium pratense]
RTLPKISKEEFELIFDELDDTHDVKINKDEFADICNAIALRFQKEDVNSYFDYLGFYHSSTSKRLKAFVKSTMFGYIVTFVLILNLVAVIIETTFKWMIVLLMVIGTLPSPALMFMGIL